MDENCLAKKRKTQLRNVYLILSLCGRIIRLLKCLLRADRTFNGYEFHMLTPSMVMARKNKHSRSVPDTMLSPTGTKRHERAIGGGNGMLSVC
jgi:hypothetical protein